MASPLDANGELVVSFTGKVRNLARVAELTNAVIDIATSGAWRQYTTAVGRETWREAELDYFLIACDMRYDDVSRVLAWNAQAKELAPMMDKDADRAHRRTLEEAAVQWHPPTGEPLIDRAKRLGWLRDNGALRRSPIPARARAQAKHGMTFEERANRTRPQRIPPARRKALDTIAQRLRAELADEHERRYVLERLARDDAGRPVASPAELAAWRADAEELDWNTARLAERWEVSRRGAQKRVERLREPATPD
ncbi:MAG: hypothetical protein QOD83_2201 [Solirubrobacteraceae bacterium]|jgi:hypothetical protein|nr:hypothetical protein [Solirubrobacteraceae bacterium]